jgi:hypothetical protein
VPTLVGGGTPRFTSISVSGFDTCGVEVLSGLGYCWGYGELVPYLIAPPLSSGRASGATEVATHPATAGVASFARFLRVNSCGVPTPCDHTR